MTFKGVMMIKNIILVVFLALAGGGWFYLDYSNKQSQAETMELRANMEKARFDVQSQSRAQAEAKQRVKLQDCESASEKTRADFLAASGKPVRGKPNELTLARDALDQADKKFKDDNAACWVLYVDAISKGT